jgi:hypothetical protein
MAVLARCHADWSDLPKATIRCINLKIDVLPGDGRDLFGGFRALRIPGPFLVLQEPRED